MKIDFYKTNERLEPTVENYLFTKELAQVMNGEFIDQDGQWYQVTGQTMPEIKINPDSPFEFRPPPAPDVFVYPVNNRPYR